MVNSQDMRTFALECLRWSEETDNASQRDIMVGLAKTWMNAANQIERHIAAGGETQANLQARLTPRVFCSALREAVAECRRRCRRQRLAKYAKPLLPLGSQRLASKLTPSGYVAALLGRF